MASGGPAPYQLKSAVWGKKSPSSLRSNACIKRCFCVSAGFALTPTFPAPPLPPKSPFAGALGLFYQFLSLYGVWCGMAPSLCLAALVFVCAVPPSTSPAVAAATRSLVAHAERFLCMQWTVWGSDASACAMARHGAAWLARSGLQDLSAARQRPLHGASPQLCTPWLRTPSGCCARSGQTVALMCGLVQWCDLMQCCWPQKTRALFTAVRFTPPSFSRTINTTHLLSFQL